MPITRSIPLLCTSKIRSIVGGESSRTPSTSPPQATADWRRASERALPWPLAAPMSARRQPSVQVVSGVLTGLLIDLNATLVGSSSGEPFGGAGGRGGGRSGGRPALREQAAQVIPERLPAGP